jgi:hypothetical protein
MVLNHKYFKQGTWKNRIDDWHDNYRAEFADLPDHGNSGLKSQMKAALAKLKKDHPELRGWYVVFTAQTHTRAEERWKRR